MNSILFILVLNVSGAIVCALKNVRELGDGEDCKDRLYGDRSEDSSSDWVYEDRSDSSSDSGPGEEITSTVYQNVKRYYCATDNADPENVSSIIFATNEWRFPSQDVNLTLSYPTSDGSVGYNAAMNDQVGLKDLSHETAWSKFSWLKCQGERDYIITAMEVYLFFDGNPISKGFVTAGGMNQDFISLEFIIPGTKRLYYQFRLDGVSKTSPYQETFLEHTTICN